MGVYMIKDERRNYLVNKNQKLVNKLNEILGAESTKIMSQRELASILNCANSTVARWCSGESIISIETAAKLCDVLGLDKEEYLNYDDLFSKNIELETLEQSEQKENYQIEDESLISKVRMLEKFDKLSDESKEKLYEYMDFLLFAQENKRKQERKKKKKKHNLSNK